MVMLLACVSISAAPLRTGERQPGHVRRIARVRLQRAAVKAERADLHVERLIAGVVSVPPLRLKIEVPVALASRPNVTPLPRPP